MTSGKKIIRILAGVCALLWMVLIFHYSNQVAVESSEISQGISYQLVAATDELFQLHLQVERIQEISNHIEVFVRKFAHMTEYGILAVFYLLCLQGDFLWERGISIKKNGIAWILAIVYAATDEIHQLFVEGRSGKVTDVMIDATGAFLALFLMGALAFYIQKRRCKKKGQ